MWRVLLLVSILSGCAAVQPPPRDPASQALEPGGSSRGGPTGGPVPGGFCLGCYSGLRGCW